MSTEARQNRPERFDVLIIGAGFSGLCMAATLQMERDSSFVILEKAESVGGTWRENVYPGAECDVKSHLYSLSFEGNPDWSTRYSGQAEILAYIEGCFTRRDLMRHVRFNRLVTSAHWSDSDAEWTVGTADGARFQARVVVLGTGPLHVPKIPDIPGLDSFAGRTFHSAQWVHEHGLDGRRVASIGTGASAIQYVPAIAPVVEHLSVFQRTAPWIVPRGNREYSGLEKTLFRTFPSLRKLLRGLIYATNESRVLLFKESGYAARLEPLLLMHLKRQVSDAELRANLTPDIAIGCKRVLISSEYYPALMRQNVELVTEAIQEVSPEGVVTTDGRLHPVDTLILGTGFETDPRRYMGAFDVRGQAGQSLSEAWDEGARAYLGLAVSGFPNLFLMVGPNTGLGHSSLIYMIECQASYVLRCLKAMDERGARAMGVRPEQVSAFVTEVDKKLEGTVWSSGCSSWYQQESGRNFALWPETTWSYQRRTRRVQAEHYNWIE